MLAFPSLKTGAPAQYPFRTRTNYRADIVWFLDGSEQRFRNSPSPLHEWTVDLSQLDEQEIANIEAFFVETAGEAQTFAFTDPSTNVTYPNCSFADASIVIAYDEVLSGKVTLVIRENRA